MNLSSGAPTFLTRTSARPPEQLHCSLFTIHSITNPPPQSDIHLPLSPLTSLVLSEYRPHGQNPSAYSKALKYQKRTTFFLFLFAHSKILCKFAMSITPPALTPGGSCDDTYIKGVF